MISDGLNALTQRKSWNRMCTLQRWAATVPGAALRTEGDVPFYLALLLSGMNYCHSEVLGATWATNTT